VKKQRKTGNAFDEVAMMAGSCRVFTEIAALFSEITATGTGL
jgi:hypothetical protein